MIRSLLTLVIVAALQGCATAPGQPDPWEGFNRHAFAFNESVDRHLVKPVARGYEKVTPAFARTAVNNFFGNLGDAWTAVNQFLQGKPDDGFRDTGRFIINSTFGIFGLIDIATPAGIEKHEEDFGQTLAVWGAGPGPHQ